MHSLHKIISVKKSGSYTLELQFDDGIVRTINFKPILKGEMYGPLIDEKLFDQVLLDQEVKTIVWPSGADFDPSTLYHWDEYGKELQKRAMQWEKDEIKFTRG